MNVVRLYYFYYIIFLIFISCLTLKVFNATYVKLCVLLSVSSILMTLCENHGYSVLDPSISFDQVVSGRCNVSIKNIVIILNKHQTIRALYFTAIVFSEISLLFVRS